MRSSLARAAGAVVATAVTASCAFTLATAPASFTDATDTSLAVAASASFGLTPPAAATGCVSEDGSSGSCQDGTALSAARAVAVSPDGASVYAAAYNSNAVAVFSRASSTGVLTQLAGTAGCVSANGSSGACATLAALNGATDLAVSPDGKHVYVAADSNPVLGFSRNASTGALTALSACGGPGVCWGTRAHYEPIGLTVSPDGANVYVVSSSSSILHVLARDATTGVLTPLAGTAGCVSATGSDGNSGGVCAVGIGMGGASSVAVSPDGASVYVTGKSDDTVAVFARNASTGALTQLASTAGCVSETGSSGACVDGRALDGASDVVVSPDGSSVYVTSSFSNAVVVFARDASTGALTQPADTTGCVSETGSSGTCADGVALVTAGAVVVSPDGEDVFVGSSGSSAVAVFWRTAATGALQQASSTRACVSQSGTGGSCDTGRGLSGVAGLAVTADGADVYVAARTGHAVTLLTRLP